MSALYVFLRHITALIYPVRCPVCNKIIGATDTFCDKCQSELVKYDSYFTIPQVKKSVAPYVYNDKISPAIFLMKDGIGGNAPYAFGKALAETIKSADIQVDFIVPVPIYSQDQCRRGYNQAELIAKETGRILKIKVRSDIVYKNRKTRPQKELTKSQRKINLKGAFSVNNKSEVADKRILIIDDICTTGSTVAEIADILTKCGADSIFCACACKTVFERKNL